MKKIILMLFFAVTISELIAQDQFLKYDRVGNFREGMAPVYLGKNVGYIDKTGKEVVPVIYEEDYTPDEFTEGVAIVTINKLFGLVDNTGKLIVPCEYKYIGAFSEGLAEAYKENGKVGFINTKGEVVIPFQYTISTLYGGAKCINGMIPVRNSAGKYGYIDKSNKLIVPFLYEVQQNFSDGLAMAKRVYNGKVSYLNTKGETVIAEKYDNGTLFIDGLAYINIGAKEKSLYGGLEGGKWGVIDKTGKEIIPIVYDKIYEIKNGLTVVAIGKYPNEKKGLIGKDGKIILPVEYYDIKILKDRVVANRVFVGPYVLFNYSGKQLGDFTWHLFDIFPDYAEGLLRVQEVSNNKLGKVGAIDANGVLKIPFIYSSIGQFYDGLATVIVDNKFGAIDKTGKIVIPAQYDEMNSFSEGWAGVKKNGKYGFINKYGKLMMFTKTTAQSTVTEKKLAVAETYQHKEKFFDFFVVVNAAVPSGVEGESTGGKFGILSRDEKVIIPAKYDWISIDTGNKAFYVQTGIKVFFSAKGTRTEPTSDTRIGILNYEGKQLFPPILSTYSIRPNKHILVKDAITLKWGVLNTNYKPVVPFNYNLIYNFSDSGIAAKKNEKYGIINLKNEILQPFEFDTVYSGVNQAPGGYQLVKMGKSIWVDSKGRIIQSAINNTGNSKQKVNYTSASVLIDDNFDNNKNNWTVWENEGSAAQFYNGNYRFAVKQSNNYLSWLSVPNLSSNQASDFAIETKMFLHNTETGNVYDSYWLLWGVGNSGKDYYAFGIYPEGKFQYGKLVNGVWDAKAGSIYSAIINAGANKANTLRVEKIRDSIFFLINGKQIYKAKYEEFNKAYAGVGFQLNNKKLLDIDYLKIFQGPLVNTVQSPEPHETIYKKELASSNNYTERGLAFAKYVDALITTQLTESEKETLLIKKQKK
jgi:WG containing repeat